MELHLTHCHYLKTQLLEYEPPSKSSSLGFIRGKNHIPRGRGEEEQLRLLLTLSNIQNSTGPVPRLYRFKVRRDDQRTKRFSAANNTITAIRAQDAGIIRYPYMRIQILGLGVMSATMPLPALSR